MKLVTSLTAAAIALLTGSVPAEPGMAGEPIVSSAFTRELGAGESGGDVLAALAEGDYPGSLESLDRAIDLEVTRQ